MKYNHHNGGYTIVINKRVENIKPGLNHDKSNLDEPGLVWHIGRTEKS